MNMAFWSFGGSMSLIGLLCVILEVELDGWNACEIVGNGRSAREEGNDVLRFGSTL